MQSKINMSSTLSKISKSPKHIIGIIVVLVIATVGVWLLTSSFAASQYVAIQATSGGLTCPAAVAPNSSASSGQYVNFGNPSSCTGGGGIPAGSSVYILGDSITVRAESDYTSQLAAKGITANIDGSVSRSLSVPGVTSGFTTTGMQAISLDKSEISSAAAIVIALGTNGGDTPQTVDQAIAAIRADNSKAPIYWVDTIAVNNAGLTQQIQTDNNAIYSQASPDNYTVISWFKTVNPSGNPLAVTTNEPDPNGYIDNSDGLGVHPNAAGDNALASLVVGKITAGSSTGGGGGSGGGGGGTGAMAPPSGYSASQLTMDDQFTGTSLNTNNWNTYYGPGTPWQDNGALGSGFSGGNQPGSNDSAIYNGSQVSVNNGLTLTAQRYNGSYSNLGYSWISGIITSRNPLPSGGWYVQVKAQMPDTSQGMWPAIWALPNNSSQELDGYEGGWPGSSPNQQGHSDTFASSGENQQVWSTPGGANLSNSYNVYGFKYTPGGTMNFYFNGTQVYSSQGSSALSTQAYYLFIQLQVAAGQTSGWHTVTNANTPASSMKVAEVQIYN